jgi:hypothetical protein
MSYKGFVKLIILFLLFISCSLYSQRIKWEESFDDTEVLARGWKLVNNDKGSSDIELYSPFEFFMLGDQGAQSGNYFFKLGFESVNRFNMIDDWIITPRLYDIHEGDSISFWCGAIDMQFKDSLKIWVSTTGDTIPNFTMIDYFKVSGPVGSWHKRSYDLSAYAGKSIYFAVNYYIKDAGAFGTASDNVWIDHFTLTGKGFGGVEPVSYKLFQNFPNPFNPTTDISFSIAGDSRVTINIYNTVGQQVKQLVNADYKKGTYTVNFDGTDLASGVYFYKINAGDFTEKKKMVLVK